MIVVTHEMGFARDVADRIVFMDDGFFIEQGPPGPTVFFHPKHERTKQFLRHILPEKEPQHAKELGIIPEGEEAETPAGPGDSALEAAISEGHLAEDTALPEIPLSGGPMGEVPLPPGDEEL